MPTTDTIKQERMNVCTFTNIIVKEEADFMVWGVMTNVIHPV